MLYLDSTLQLSYLGLQARDVLLVSRAEPGGALQKWGAARTCPHPIAHLEPAAGSFTSSYHLPGMISNVL